MSVWSFVAGAVAGSTLGVGVTVALQPSVERLRETLLRLAHKPINARRLGKFTSPRLLQRQLQYFEERGLLDNVYKTRTLATELVVPLLFDTSIAVQSVLNPRREEIAAIVDSEFHELPVDRKIIERRTRDGAYLFDGRIAYIKQVRMNALGQTSLELASCNYFAFVTRIERLRVALATGRHSAVLDRISSLKLLLSLPEAPTILGCTCVSIFDTQGGPYVALQRRSAEVVTWPSALATIPIFGLEPNVVKNRRSRYGLLAYNFLKEFIEEFYDMEEFTKAALEKRADPDWLFTNRMAHGLIEELEQNRLALSCAGVYGDLQDGRLALVLVARFRSDSFYQELYRDVIASRESDHIEFAPLFGPGIEEQMRNGLMEPGSVLALDLVRSAWPHV